MRTQAELQETEREADRNAAQSRPPLFTHNGYRSEPEQIRPEGCSWCRADLEKDIERADNAAAHELIWLQRRSLIWLVSCSCGWQPENPSLMERQALDVWALHAQESE